MKRLNTIRSKISACLITALIMTLPGNGVLAKGLNNGSEGGQRKIISHRTARASSSDIAEDDGYWLDEDIDRATASDIDRATASDIDKASASNIRREVISINEDWTFTKDGETETVDVPHCWENYVPSQNTMDSNI